MGTDLERVCTRAAAAAFKGSGRMRGGNGCDIPSVVELQSVRRLGEEADKWRVVSGSDALYVRDNERKSDG